MTAGHANVWAPMSVDEERGLVFLPTSSPSPDFWGGKRPGNNDYANSVVALRAETGERAWSYQTVHHDVWDYDLPAQPTLSRIDTGAGPRDVVIQPTKQGFVFVLDRDTGKPVWPVEERAVPQGGAEGEQLSPTQPFPTHVPPLLSQQILLRERDPERNILVRRGINFRDVWNCAAKRDHISERFHDVDLSDVEPKIVDLKMLAQPTPHVCQLRARFRN